MLFVLIAFHSAYLNGFLFLFLLFMSTGKNDRPEVNQKIINVAGWLLDAFTNFASLQIRFNFMKSVVKNRK